MGERQQEHGRDERREGAGADLGSLQVVGGDGEGHPRERQCDVEDRVVHLPGQHYVVRLTAEDGYTAQRSYSVASAPGDPLVEARCERIAEEGGDWKYFGAPKD